MVQLSVVIIAFNEEKNIERCLRSVEGLADEVVVVDSGSTDETINICNQHNAKVVHQDFLGHIEQKNFAISQASNIHILSLDADESLDDQLKNEIAKIKENWVCDGYEMNRLTNYCGKWIRHTGWYPDRKLRLWKSTNGKWTGVNPHDRFELTKGSSIGSLKGDILHYSFYTINQHLAQIQYFTDISSKALYAKGKRSSIVKILLSPVVKFYRDYIWKMGFLDGFYGLVISVNSAHAKFLKYSKLYHLQKTEKSRK